MRVFSVFRSVLSQRICENTSFSNISVSSAKKQNNKRDKKILRL